MRPIFAADIAISLTSATVNGLLPAGPSIQPPLWEGDLSTVGSIAARSG